MSQTREDAATPAGALQLSVKTADAQSEIVLLDGRGRFVDRAFGPVHSFALEPGLYRVKVLTGTEVDERSVALTEGPRELEFAAAPFVSAAPLFGTTTSHEYHVAAAAAETRHTHVHDGDGSSLFFLVRDWTPNAAATGRIRRIVDNPAQGLSLFAIGANGERKVCDLTAGVSNLDLDAWAACTIDVAPGVYELRLEVPTGAVLHQAVVASPGWQSQAFVFMRGYSAGEGSADRVWRADLSRTSLLLSATKSFSPGERQVRLAELARVALATKRSNDRREENRRLLPDELRVMLRGKCDNPILGIYAAHLLLMESRVDEPLVQEAVVHLRDLLRAPHPDVEALALRANLGEPRGPFTDPPMLRRSWALIVDASITRPQLVTDALAGRLTTSFLSEGPWHIWATAPAPSGDRPATLSDLEAAMLDDLGVLKQVRQRRADSARETAPRSMALRPGVIPVELSEERLRLLARRFSLPPAQLRRVIADLEEKTARSPDLSDVKFSIKP
jgi:hypothetical protein